MTATGHAILGAVIAAKIGNPALSIPIAVASHIAADAVPHWDVATNSKQKGKERVLKEAVADVVLGFVLSFLILKTFFPTTNLSYAFVIIIASQSLDWLMAPYYFFNINFPLFTYAYNLQKKFENRLREPWGIILQAIIVSSTVLLAKVF